MIPRGAPAGASGLRNGGSGLGPALAGGAAGQPAGFDPRALLLWRGRAAGLLAGRCREPGVPDHAHQREGGAA